MSERFPTLPPPPEEEDDDGDGRSPFDELMAAAGPPFELPTPTCWWEIPLADLPAEWDELRAWVESLVRRYPHLDVHFIPPCWFRHPSHVEALVALRDHERVSFAEISPATAPVQFQVALGQIESRLRIYTDAAGCLSTHREPVNPLVPPSDETWQEFVTADVNRRRMESLENVVATPDSPLSQEVTKTAPDPSLPA